MRPWLFSLALAALAPAAAVGQIAPAPVDVSASPPQALSVTVYRNPYRSAGSINLNYLGGFALVTETRTVHLPSGESRLRFEGVVDGIQPASAIVTGLPGGVIEKNRDAALLSPETLIRAAIGSDLTLVRTNRKTGKTTTVPATIRSANEQGVVFQTADGVETLHCSGLPETMRFSRAPKGLSSTPTLSVLTRARQPVTARVTLSYLAEGFDWAADYVAHINPDGKTLNLGAWITLANGNSVSLPGASTQIVAGKLNRVGPIDPTSWASPRVIARCWPQGSTSDRPKDRVIEMANASDGAVTVYANARGFMLQKAPAPMAMAPPPPPPPPPPPEQLGDLKLYRVPHITTIAANQSKQVRLLEQADVPFTRLATADLMAGGTLSSMPASVMLRTRNTLANKLGLPLPAGNVAVFGRAAGRDLLQGQVDLRDTAVGEDVELRMGVAPDIQVRQTQLRYTARAPALIDLTPELTALYRRGVMVEEVEITNARDVATPFELRLQTYGSLHVSAADQPMALKDSRPIFRLTLPANGRVKVRYTVSR